MDRRPPALVPAPSRPTVVFVLGLAPVKIGGIEKFLRLFVLSMDGAGWDTVLCFDGPVCDAFRDSVRFPFCHIEAVSRQGGLGFAAAGSLWSVLRRYRPQRFLYAFHGVMRCFPWLARLAGCSGIAFYDHSSRAPEFIARPLPLPKRIVGRLLTLPLQQVISVSDFTRRTGDALGLTACPNTVLPNGVFLPERSDERGSLFRQTHGIPADAVVIAQLCWMVPVKGVETLLHAAVTVLRQVPSAFFLLVGDGPQRGQYQDLARTLGIADRVLFTGVISDPTAQGVMEAADVYCQPSIWQEAAGLAVMEAMSFGVPPVVSRIGGLPELVREGVNGCLFSPGDANDLADRLGRLASDPNLRHSLGDAARRTIEAHHQIQATADGCVELILNGPDQLARTPSLGGIRV